MRAGSARVAGLLLAAVLSASAAAGSSAAAPSPPADPVRGPLLPALSDAPAPAPDALRAALAPPLADPALGGVVGASVVDVRSGAVLLDVAAGRPLLPASTAKLATAAAALTALPPDLRLTTRVLAGPLPGDVVLVGGGDPTLSSSPAPTDGAASLPALAGQVRAALPGPVRRVLVDDTAYAGPPLGPGWRPGYVSGGNVAPVSALSVDGGRAVPTRDDRVADPAVAAGRALAALLGAPAAAVVRGAAPGRAAVLGSVDSAPLTVLVELMLRRSDNDLAEALAHRLALAQGRPGTFADGAAAQRAALARLLGTAPGALADGSGLSREDSLPPAALTRLLVLAAQDPGRLGPLLSGLPVAGWAGTLARRYRTGPSAGAAGVVRAKTGTLEGVSALAGLLRTADGRLLAFDLTLGAVPPGRTAAAEAALDRAAAVLAGCGCR